MIISLTTIPKRIEHIHLVIESLKRQTKPITKILLWIPYTYRGKDEYVIPDYLKNEKIVDVIRCDDLGPATKFLHTIKYLKGGEDFVVIDDDTIYSQYLIEDLTALPNLYGAKCVKGTAFGEWNQKAVKSRDPDYPDRQRKSIRVSAVPNKFKNREKLDNFDCINVRCVPIICGCDGILLNTSFFNKEIFKLKKQFDKCDDIWLSGFLAAKNIGKYAVPCRTINYTGTDFKELFTTSNTGGTIINFNSNKEHIKFKPQEIPHIRYISNINPLDGGKYETINNYKSAVNAFGA